MDDVRWLDERELRAWRSLQFMQMRLEGELARQLAADSGLSYPDYLVLVALTDAHRPTAGHDSVDVPAGMAKLIVARQLSAGAGSSHSSRRASGVCATAGGALRSASRRMPPE